VQVTYLGYPQTTGLRAIDYRLTDPFLDPVGGDESFNSEKLVRLPESYFLYRPPDNAPEVGPVPSETSGAVTFASFNSLIKVNPHTVRVWARILHQVPGSRLIIKAQGAGNPGAQRDYAAAFAEHGIEQARLEFQGFSSLRSAMQELSRVDVALDTFPFTGGTTSCHVLWMGVPVVTLAGKMPFARMGVSVLSNIGLTDLIGQSEEQYVQIATQLGSNVQRLHELRGTMRDRMEKSPLMIGPRFVAGLETVYREMWQSWCSKQ
jgi:predicted O-linked N-acetylglucosamine transferase (SPINDLY family)